MNFPYKFRNTREFVYTSRETKAESLDTVNQMLDVKEYNLREGFSMAYYTFLQNVRDNSIKDIGSYTERSLYREVTEGMQELQRETERIDILNENYYPENVNIRVIDFNQTFGCFIDREENKARGVQRRKSMLMKEKENFEVYMPEIKSLGDFLPMNFEMLIRIESNLKLNPIGRKGESLIPKEELEQEEVHFLRFESTVQTFEISFSTIFKLFKDIAKTPDLKFSDWTLTDIDVHLNGNPHVQE